MQAKTQCIDGIAIDYSKSSIEVFPALQLLAGSTGLYLKFSKNHIRGKHDHEELSLDFDMCLIDSVMNETVIQLFAILSVTKDGEAVDQWKYVHQAVAFARSLIVEEIKKLDLRDTQQIPVKVPEFTLPAAVINDGFSAEC